MPGYEYRCRKCGHVTSFLEKAGSRKAHTCKKCGSKNTEKVFSTRTNFFRVIMGAAKPAASSAAVTTSSNLSSRAALGFCASMQRCSCIRLIRAGAARGAVSVQRR